MEHTGSEFWLAENRGVLVAYLKINFDQRIKPMEDVQSVQVERLYVAPSYQGQRIGEKMLDLAQKRGIIKGASWLWLTVWQENPAAKRFYERCGFEVFGTTVYMLGEDAQHDWLMRKSV